MKNGFEDALQKLNLFQVFCDNLLVKYFSGLFPIQVEGCSKFELEFLRGSGKKKKKKFIEK